MIRLLVFYCFITNVIADINVHCHGQGPQVYLIGGGPAFTTWNLQPVQEALSRHFEVCRWDMRGVGDNAQLPITSQTSVLSQWLADMDQVLPQKQVVLWGHSWGALQAMLFARQYPERISKLVLSNPVDPALLSLEHIAHKRYVHTEIESRLGLEDIGTAVEHRHNFRSKIASYFIDARQGWDYALGFSEQDTNNKLNVRIWDEYRKVALSDSDVIQLADRISGLIYCQYDVLQPENLAEYRRLLASNKHHMLTGCGHFPWEENAEVYFRLLDRLLNK